MLPDETKTLGEKAAFAIIELIKQNHFRAGDKLPNEYELSESLGVSRNTVREALKVLASRNIVMIRQGAGTFISEKMGISDDPLGFSFVEDRIRLTKDLAPSCPWARRSRWKLWENRRKPACCLTGNLPELPC